MSRRRVAHVSYIPYLANSDLAVLAAAGAALCATHQPPYRRIFCMKNEPRRLWKTRLPYAVTKSILVPLLSTPISILAVTVLPKDSSQVKLMRCGIICCDYASGTSYPGHSTIDSLNLFRKYYVHYSCASIVCRPIPTSVQ